VSAPAETLLGEEDDVILSSRKAKRGNPEIAVVKAIRHWLMLAVPGAVVWGSPNEVPYRADNKREGWAMMGKRRAAGAAKGAPDLTVALPGGGVIFLEAKAPRGVVTAAQIEFHERLRAIGHRVAVVRSLDDAQAVFRAAGVVR